MAEALAKVESASTRAALAQDIFGRAGTTLLPLVAEGAEGLEALRQKARDLGNTFTTEGAASAAAFKDAINELKQRALGRARHRPRSIVPSPDEHAGLVHREPVEHTHRVHTRSAQTVAVVRGNPGVIAGDPCGQVDLSRPWPQPPTPVASPRSE